MSSEKSNEDPGTLERKLDFDDEIVSPPEYSESSIEPLESAEIEKEPDLVAIDLHDDAEAEQSSSFFSSPFTHLYASSAISAWGDRMFGFVVPIYFVELFPSTLLPAALFALVSKIVCVFLGPHVGSFVDKAGRLKVIRTSMIGENFCVGMSILCLILMNQFRSSGDAPYSNPYFAVLFSIIMAFGAISSVAGMACSVAINKDWAVAMAAGDAKTLSRMNAVIRQISLGCEIGAPLFSGILLAFTNASVALYFLAAWNFVTFFPELFLLQGVYHRVPSLSAPKVVKAGSAKPGPFKALWDGYKLYFAQRAFLPSLAYVLLYMTVLSPGAMLTAFMKSQGVSETVIGAFRGVSALAGLTATLVCPKLIDKLGLPKAGIISIWIQWGALVPAVFCFLVPKIGIYFFLMFLVFSRFGLWSFDLAETQVMQTYVNSECRGSVNAVESALANFASIVSFGWGVVIPDPAHFWVLVLLSFTFITIAAILYSVWVKRELTNYAELIE